MRRRARERAEARQRLAAAIAAYDEVVIAHLAAVRQTGEEGSATRQRIEAAACLRTALGRYVTITLGSQRDQGALEQMQRVAPGLRADALATDLEEGGGRPR